MIFAALTPCCSTLVLLTTWQLIVECGEKCPECGAKAEHPDERTDHL